MTSGRILSTIDLPHRPDWTARVDGIDRASLSHAALIRRLVREGPRHDGVILDASVGPGERYSDLLAAAALARRRTGPPVVLAECTWKLGDSRADRLACRAGAHSSKVLKLTVAVPEASPARVTVMSIWPEPSLIANSSVEN